MLPNMLSPLMTEFGLRLCSNFLLIASLSFLGLGIQPPLADWGSMVRDNAAAIAFGGVAPLIPAAAIGAFAIGVNLITDWSIAIQSRQQD
jgi:peptide/nickel transport system permease protein